MEDDASWKSRGSSALAFPRGLENGRLEEKASLRSAFPSELKLRSFAVSHTYHSPCCYLEKRTFLKSVDKHSAYGLTAKAVVGYTPSSGRLAQRESACLTSRMSLVQIQYRPPATTSTLWAFGEASSTKPHNRLRRRLVVMLVGSVYLNFLEQVRMDTVLLHRLLERPLALQRFYSRLRPEFLRKPLLFDHRFPFLRDPGFLSWHLVSFKGSTILCASPRPPCLHVAVFRACTFLHLPLF